MRPAPWPPLCLQMIDVVKRYGLLHGPGNSVVLGAPKLIAFNNHAPGVDCGGGFHPITASTQVSKSSAAS